MVVLNNSQSLSSKKLTFLPHVWLWSPGLSYWLHCPPPPYIHWCYCSISSYPWSCRRRAENTDETNAGYGQEAPSVYVHVSNTEHEWAFRGKIRNKNMVILIVGSVHRSSKEKGAGYRGGGKHERKWSELCWPRVLHKFPFLCSGRTVVFCSLFLQDTYN